MKAIKALVIFMGVLIVAGLGLLGYGMYTKAGRSVKPSTVTTPPGAVVLPADVEAFGALDLPQPPGTRIAAATVSGGVLVLHLTDGGRPDRVTLIDLGRGSVLGNVRLTPRVEAPSAQ